MHSRIFYISLFLLSFPSLVSAASDTETTSESWILKRDREGVQVYTRKVEGSPYDAVRATTIIDGTRLSSLVALLLDSESCPDWADKCAESYVHEQISDTHLLVYTHNDLPFPVKDRDILSRVHWSQDPQTLEVLMTSEAANGILEEQRGKLRLTEANVSWHFTPQADGSIHVVNEAHVNPGSALPGWIINMLLVDTPYETMKAFRETVSQPEYANAVIDFIKEPGD